MPLFPVPRGARESTARGYFTRNGPRLFVHVHDHATFLRHYPSFKARNPTVRHKYIFEGQILPASTIIRVLERRQRNLLNSMTSRGRSVSPQPVRRSSRTKTPSVRLGRPASAVKRRRPKARAPLTGKQRRIRSAPLRSPFI